MKKFLPLLLMILLLATGCGSEDDKIKIGTIKYLNVSEEAFSQLYEKSRVTDSDTAKYKYIFFDNINSMTAALQAGQIDAMSIYESVANYIAVRNNNVEWTIEQPVLIDLFCCAMREEDAELRNEFNFAIKEMTADGTLARFVKTYINDFTRNETPSVISLPTFYNAPMIRIGVTGDLPMLDYIRPDGMPAGFNTALLSEISRRIEKNFVFVQVESGARAAALSSKEVDVIFWAVVPQTEGVPPDFDKPDGVILTEPYFSDDIVHVKLRK